jgi:hypothetical protein
MKIARQRLTAIFKPRSIIALVLGTWLLTGLFDWLITRISQLDVQPKQRGFEITGAVTGNLGKSLAKQGGNGQTTVLLFASIGENRQSLKEPERVRVGDWSLVNGTNFSVSFECNDIKQLIFPVQGVEWRWGTKDLSDLEFYVEVNPRLMFIQPFARKPQENVTMQVKRSCPTLLKVN